MDNDLNHLAQHSLIVTRHHISLILTDLNGVTKGKGKKRKSIYIASSLKAPRHGSHSYTCKLHYACLSFISVHQMAPPLNVVANI